MNTVETLTPLFSLRTKTSLLSLSTVDRLKDLNIGYHGGGGVDPIPCVSTHRTSKSVPASTRLEDPSRKGTTRTAKSAPFNPCPSREGPYSTVFSVSRPMDPLMWLAGLLALSGDVETNPGPTTQTWTCDMCSTEITGRQTSYKCNSSPSHWVHKHCTTLIRNTDYTPTWKCNIHNQQNNTITDQHHQLTDNTIICNKI